MRILLFISLLFLSPALAFTFTSKDHNLIFALWHNNQLDIKKKSLTLHYLRSNIWVIHSSEPLAIVQE